MQARAVAVLRVCVNCNGTAWRRAPCFKLQPQTPRRRGLPTDGTAASVITMQQSPPRAASWCIWTGRLQAGPSQNPTLSWPTAVSPSRWCRPSPRLRGLDEHDACGCLRRGRCSHGHCGHGALCALTFELSGRRRQDARPDGRKMCQPGRRAWWPAVGAPLERGVRPRRRLSQHSQGS